MSMMNVMAVIAASGFANARSLDFEASSSQYLSRTWGAGGKSRRIGTWSFWYKRESINADMRLFTGGDGTSSNVLQIAIGNTNKIEISHVAGGSTTLNKVSVATFSDTAAWHHLVVAIDTTQGTAADRVKVWHDGVQITSWSPDTIFAQNTDMVINNGSFAYAIARTNHAVSGFYDGLLDEIIYVDGQALTPASFALNSKPMAYGGTYGAKGFRLRFENTGSLGLDDSGNGNDWTLNAAPVSSTDVP